MKRDVERIQRIQAALQEESLDALICALPNHVVLMSGYWPVTGVSLAIATRDGRVVALAPEDEKELAEHGWADEVRTFRAASLRELRSPAEIVREVLKKTAGDLGLGRGSAIGYEDNEASVPAPYAALHLFGPALPELIQEAVPQAKLSGANELLRRLESVLTSDELDRVRAACQIGGAAFLEGARALRAGLVEPQAVNAFQAALSAHGKSSNEIERAGGWVWCMSGPNAAKAYGAYARTRDRRIQTGDLVLIHCNSYADGYWTDITRTFCLGEADERKRLLYDAVFTAFHAALDTIKPGVRAAEVDRAARGVMEAHGFGKEFKHATGHGVGFSAISHNAKPRLHPVSPDVLETGMVFNVEPAVYIAGYGGLRHCNMVGVTNKGAELLTPFQTSPDALVIVH